MPKGLALTIAFIIALALNVIAPSLFGVYAHGAMPVFLSAMLLYFGVNEFSIIVGLIFAFFGEILLGSVMGVVMIPFLAVTVALVFIQRLVNSKPLVLDEGGIGSGVMAVIVGLFLAGVSLIATSMAQYVLAGQPLTLSVWLKNYLVPIYYSGTLVIFLLLLRLFSYKRQTE